MGYLLLIAYDLQLALMEPTYFFLSIKFLFHLLSRGLDTQHHKPENAGKLKTRQLIQKESIP